MKPGRLSLIAVTLVLILCSGGSVLAQFPTSTIGVWNLTITVSASPPAGGVVNYSNGALAPPVSPVTNGTTVSLVAAPAPGSVFVGWSGACSGNKGCSISMNNHKTVTATFALPKLTVQVGGSGTGSVVSQPAGIDCGGRNTDCSESLLKGTQVTFNTSPGTGYLYAKTCGNTITLDADKTCTFTFNRPVLTVEKSGSGTLTAPGINCGTDCTETVDLGTSVQVQASPGTGVVLRRWLNGCTHSQSACAVTMNGNKTVTAEFGRPRVVVTKIGTGSGTVTSLPAAINCGSTCAGEFDPTTVVGLTAKHDPGSIFEGWSGNFSPVSNQPNSAQVNTSQKPYAEGSVRFTKVYTLNVGVKGNGSVKSTDGKINCPGDCEESYTSGSTIVVLYYTVKVGSAFVGWGDSCTGTNSQCKVSLSSSDRRVTAEFK